MLWVGKLSKTYPLKGKLISSLICMDNTIYLKNVTLPKNTARKRGMVTWKWLPLENGVEIEWSGVKGEFSSLALCSKCIHTQTHTHTHFGSLNCLTMRVFMYSYNNFFEELKYEHHWSIYLTWFTHPLPHIICPFLRISGVTNYSENAKLDG